MFAQLYKPFGKAPQVGEMERSTAFRHGVFVNEDPTAMHFGLSGTWKIAKRYWSRDVEASPSGEYIFKETGREILQGPGIHVNWLGHAGVLVHWEGKFILLDPVLSERASPFSFMGPERFFPSPIPLDEIPPLEAIIISHDHYDHFDYPTIKALEVRTKAFYVPLGLGTTLKSWGVTESKIVEADWWESIQVDGMHITAAPARHFSGRFLKRNNTLWASWVIEVGGKKLYFGGDSGYFSGYKKIAEKKGLFDLTFMPVGAYDEMWAEIHLNPEEAVQAHRDLRGGQFFPIHWGTFDLGLHSWSEPMERLVKEALAKNVALLAPEPGRWIKVGETQVDPYWWERFKGK